MNETSRPGPGRPPRPDPTGIDAYAPAEIPARVEKAGIGKARLPGISLMALAMLAGAFIAFGAMLYTLVMTGSGLGFGVARLVGGAAFSLGLILVIVGGAELFTGNALIVMAAASRRISIAALLRNWGIVYLGDFVGSLGAAVRCICRVRWRWRPARSARRRARSREPSWRCPPIRLF
ncbi:MAG TPA: formate/nitrite transporter family protein, partial [Stellaceae bacterium]|nr:formate/nitrite transporter family protein [Stellaceae bacterium]